MKTTSGYVTPDYAELSVPSIDLMEKLGIGIIQVEDTLVLAFKSPKLMRSIGQAFMRGGEVTRIALAPLDADPEDRKVALDIAREIFPYE